MDRLSKVPFIICLMLSFNAHAQMNLPSGESGFYWDVNNSPSEDIYEIVDKNISIKYLKN